MRRSIIAFPAAALLVASSYAAAPAQASTPSTPGSFGAISATAGPNLGEITFSWTQDGSNTTSFHLETALTRFSTSGSTTLPRYGRNHKVLTISPSVRKLTLSAAQVIADGAPTPSGNTLYYRFQALDTDASGATTVRNDAGLKAALPQAQAPATVGAKLRIASFNVRTARATTDTRTWLERAPDVAKTIVAHDPGVVGLQELGPGRADGVTGTLDGHERQTDSLIRELGNASGQKYKLVRTTPYVQSGTLSGTQGMRILYDTQRYTQLSSCPDKTGTSSYSSSCSIVTPLLSGDSESLRRRAAYAEFQDKSSGKKFFFVSVHLDTRHSDTTSTDATYSALRKSQVDAVTKAVDVINPDKVPVVLGGDFNSWQNVRGGNDPHDTLITQGFYDTAAALQRVNFKYTTMNAFATTLYADSQGVGTRLDMLFVKGAPGASYFENSMLVTDSARPSDHNMIVADTVLGSSTSTTASAPWSTASVTPRTTTRR